MAAEREAASAGGGTSLEERRDSTNIEPDQDAQRSTTSSSDDQVRDKQPSSPALKKREKFKRHCVRWKWWYLVAVTILLAILLPILFKVIVPALIRTILDKQDLSITGGALQVLSPTQLNMSIATSLDTPLPARLDALDLELYNKQTKPVSPFFRLRMPGMRVSGKTAVNVPMQTLTVLNQTELVAWFNPFFEESTVGLSLRGKPRLHLGALKYSSSLDKTVVAPALNYLDGMELLKLDLQLRSNDTEYNAKGSLNIPNTGVLRLGMGNQTFNVWAGSVRLGVIYSYDVQLSPGDNAVSYEGNLFLDQVVPNLAAILDSQKDALNKGNVEIFISGNATMVNGQHIPYVEKVLNDKRIRITVPVISLLANVLGSVLDADQASLLDVFGSAFGNSTLFEHLLENWQDNRWGDDEVTSGTLSKRQKKRSSWMLSLLKLGLRAKRKPA